MALRPAFRADWEALDLADVQAFLGETIDEPLLVEAKGTRVTDHHVVKTVCGFANSDLGGYLVIGVSDRNTLEGWAFPEDSRCDQAG